LTRLDLNADVGEIGAESDARLMPSITSASLAAGFHAGNPSSLRATIRLAKAHGVAVGAHPSFDDREGFGRRERPITAQEAEDLVVYQIAAVAGVAAVEGVRLQHVKPHGALYNMAARDFQLATAIARALVSVDPSLILFAPVGSELVRAGRAAGIVVAIEGFADRAYRRDGSLAPRGVAGAMIEGGDAVTARALRMAIDHAIEAIDGVDISIDVDTICLHGDTPGADALARQVRAALDAAYVLVRPVGDWLRAR